MSEIDDSNPGLVDEKAYIPKEELLQAYLAIHSEPCPSCSYDLRKLTGGHCPECGQALTLRVGLETPNLAAFIVGLVGLAAGLGFSGMLLVVVIWFLFFDNIGGPSLFDLSFLTVQVIVSGGLTYIWAKVSGWLRRQSTSKRWVLAISCLTLPFINLIVFTMLVGP